MTNVPRLKASTKRVARLYRKRWTLETAFQPTASQTIHLAPIPNNAFQLKLLTLALKVLRTRLFESWLKTTRSWQNVDRR